MRVVFPCYAGIMDTTGRQETYLERIRKYGRDVNPFFRLMGIDVDEIGEGKACLSLQIRPDMLNGVGWMQGGIFASLADEAMALALYTQTAPDEQIATIAESTSFIRGEREGLIVGIGWVVRKGRKVAFLEGEVRKGDREGEVLARTSASFLLIK
ncbi:MAG: PaaI family thioesterase [Methanomicrobiales archaeon]|nr:PaaI family thioesterase [Methanomicrobiales archaeon]